MSRRLFTTPRDDVLTGGDRPFQSLFLVITDRHTGAIVDSNLDGPQGPGLWLDGIRQWLAAFGVTPPASLWDDLAVDRHADAGTLCVGYDEDISAGPEPSGIC